MSGFAKLYRAAVANTDLLKSHNAALVYMYVLTFARFAPKRCAWGTLEAGECDSTQTQIAEAIGLSRSQVQRAEKALMRMGLIGTRTAHKTRILIIETAGLAGDGDDEPAHKTRTKRAQGAHKTSTSRAQNAHSIEGEKGIGAEGDKGDQDSSSADAEGEFERFWSAYPRKVAKGQARKAFAAWLKKGVSLEAIMTAMRQDVAQRLNRETQYIPYASSWLNGEPWNDELPVNSQAHPVDWEPWDWQRCMREARSKAYIESEKERLAGRIRSGQALGEYRDRRQLEIARELAEKHGVTHEH